MPGELTFGRYILLDKLATGGMAEIFLAQVKGEAGFRKTCVVKRVLPHLAQRPTFREMFLNEARLAARLSHPGIVQIFDLGREGDDFYIAMEYLAGENLADVLGQAKRKDRSVPPSIAARIIASAAEALHYAHELKDDHGRPLNIVHRDVSPSNLFVTYQGGVKLLDFGVARAEQRAQETLGGHVKGKLAYMAPEQALSGPVDRRADVWSLGVCLHEALTGQRLFARDSLAATSAALVREPIPTVASLRPDVPRELSDVVTAALERDVAKRLPTAEMLRASLERFLADTAYVPPAALVSDFMAEVFGRERAESRMRLGSSAATSAIPSAVPIEGTPLLSVGSFTPRSEAKTMLAAPEEVAALRGEKTGGARRAWPLLLIALAASGLGLAWWRGVFAPAPAVVPPPSPPAPVTTAPPPPPAPTEEEAAAPTEPPSTATVEPAPEPAHPRHREPGWLSVDADVKAEAWLDGASLGALPVAHVKVGPGEHRLRLANAALGLSKTTRVRVTSGESLEHHEAIRLGTLNVTVTPWADVYLDGFRLGQTPLAGRQVVAAAHELRLVGPNGEKRVQIDVKPAQTLVVREALP